LAKTGAHDLDHELGRRDLVRSPTTWWSTREVSRRGKRVVTSTAQYAEAELKLCVETQMHP
jgi:hypothetical protein